jgi:hypothetical protein
MYMHVICIYTHTYIQRERERKRERERERERVYIDACMRSLGIRSCEGESSLCQHLLIMDNSVDLLRESEKE